jgi:hypothetical protein
MGVYLDNFRWTTDGKYVDENGVVWIVATDGSCSPEKEPSIVVPGNGYLDIAPHLFIEDTMTAERYLALVNHLTQGA